MTTLKIHNQIYLDTLGGLTVEQARTYADRCEAAIKQSYERANSDAEIEYTYDLYENVTGPDGGISVEVEDDSEDGRSDYEDTYAIADHCTVLCNQVLTDGHF